MRQISGFGFRIIGGKEEGSQVSVCEESHSLSVYKIPPLRHWTTSGGALVPDCRTGS